MTRHAARAAVGFTLVEAVAAMVILATVSGVLSGVIWTGVRSFDEGAEATRLHDEASIAMERMVRDLRAVPLTDDDAPDIASITAHSITWDSSTRSLALDGTDLVLTEDGRSGVLVSDVTAFGVQAYDASNDELAATLSGAETEPVRRLGLAIAVARGRAAAEVRTKVFLRCMMLESEQ